MAKGYGYTRGPHAILRRCATLFCQRAHNYQATEFTALVELSDFLTWDADQEARDYQSEYNRAWKLKRRVQCKLELLQQSLLDCSLVPAEVAPNMKAPASGNARSSELRTPDSMANVSHNSTNGG